LIRDESLIRLVNDSVRVEILSLGASLRRFELRQALHAVQPGQNDVVNLGAGVGYGVQEVLDACREVTGHPIPAVERGLRTGDPPTLVTRTSVRVSFSAGRSDWICTVSWLTRGLSCATAQRVVDDLDPFWNLEV